MTVGFAKKKTSLETTRRLTIILYKMTSDFPLAPVPSTLSKTFFETPKSVEEICDIVRKMTNKDMGDRYHLIEYLNPEREENSTKYIAYRIVEMYVLLGPCSLIKVNLFAGSSEDTIIVETEKRYGTTLMFTKFNEWLYNLLNFNRIPERGSIDLTSRYGDLLTDKHDKYVLMNLIDDFYDSPIVHGCIQRKFSTISDERLNAWLVFESVRTNSIMIKTGVTITKFPRSYVS